MATENLEGAQTALRSDDLSEDPVVQPGRGGSKLAEMEIQDEGVIDWLDPHMLQMTSFFFGGCIWRCADANCKD